jgi:hypothetical protein
VGPSNALPGGAGDDPAPGPEEDVEPVAITTAIAASRATRATTSARSDVRVGFVTGTVAPGAYD